MGSVVVCLGNPCYYDWTRMRRPWAGLQTLVLLIRTHPPTHTHTCTNSLDFYTHLQTRKLRTVSSHRASPVCALHRPAPEFMPGPRSVLDCLLCRRVGTVISSSVTHPWYRGSRLRIADPHTRKKALCLEFSICLQYFVFKRGCAEYCVQVCFSVVILFFQK